MGLRTDTVTMTDIRHPIAEKIAPRREDTTILTSTTEATVSKYRIEDQKYRIVKSRTSRLRPSVTLPSLHPTRTRRRRVKRTKRAKKVENPRTRAQIEHPFQPIHSKFSRFSQEINDSMLTFLSVCPCPREL